MNPLKIITKLLGWLGGAVGIKPGPDVERIPLPCRLCWEYDLTSRRHAAGEVCPNEWRRQQRN